MLPETVGVTVGVSSGLSWLPVPAAIVVAGPVAPVAPVEPVAPVSPFDASSVHLLDAPGTSVLIVATLLMYELP